MARGLAYGGRNGYSTTMRGLRMPSAPSAVETRSDSSMLETGPSRTRYMTRPLDLARSTRTGHLDAALSLACNLAAFPAAWNAPA